ncbi:NINE protein [Dysgonomonas sp. GY75]|uniref:NINE protein n=1 Tax=Dysgonomonas sp. GY75 TaxID=2780419 RepID=UPI001883F493|nr:NINE protein [Dysgonomonas sp. GY75]MBF0647889.1 NINE protein [Dysgonomonas sp. GY75]
MKSKITAALLAIFLGGIGVHRFYLNQTGLGLLYLLFCWTFIPLAVSFIDFIWLLTMDDNRFNLKFNSAYQQRYPTQTTITVNNDSRNTTNLSPGDEIKKLYELKEKDIITQEEFELKKKILL